MKHILISIQNDLQNLTGDSLFVVCLKKAVSDNRLPEAIQEIYQQSQDNRPLVSKMIGEKLLTKIENLWSQL